MFEIKKIEIEVSTLCNAKCSGCMRTMLDERQEKYLKKYLDFADIHRWFNDINLKDVNLKLCGVLGDPITNLDLEDIIFYFLYEKNVKTIEMSTNGGTRSGNFWQSLGQMSKNSKDRFYIHWAIDGVKTNFYRENVSLEKVWENVNSYHSTGGKSVWQFIIFDYNEHEIEDARNIAKKNNMKFATRKSWRNTLGTAKFKSQQSKMDLNYEVIEHKAYTLNYENPNILCRHKTDNEIYIGVDGRVWPCCHLYDEIVSKEAEQIRRVLMKMGKDFNNLYVNKLTDIVESSWYSRILEESWKKNHELHIPRCYLTCGDKGKRSVIKNMEF